MVDEYARLLESVAESGDEAAADFAVKKLVAHLVVSGRVKLLSQVAHELRKVSARKAALAPRVEVAHEKLSASALRAAAASGVEAKRTVVNPSLASGWRAQAEGTLVDHSGKRALLEIYTQALETV